MKVQVERQAKLGRNWSDRSLRLWRCTAIHQSQVNVNPILSSFFPLSSNWLALLCRLFSFGCCWGAQQEMDTSSLNVTRWNITLPIQVPYPNTNYQFFVWARSASANETLERFWSQPAKLSVTSAADRRFLVNFREWMVVLMMTISLFPPFCLCPDVARRFLDVADGHVHVGPCAPPLASMGSFEVFNTRLETRSATIYWSQIEPQCENGPDAGYVVDMLDLQGNFM